MCCASILLQASCVAGWCIRPEKPDSVCAGEHRQFQLHGSDIMTSFELSRYKRAWKARNAIFFVFRAVTAEVEKKVRNIIHRARGFIFKCTNVKSTTFTSSSTSPVKLATSCSSASRPIASIFAAITLTFTAPSCAADPFRSEQHPASHSKLVWHTKRTTA
jgi:hypothetical protein